MLCTSALRPYDIGMPARPANLFVFHTPLKSFSPHMRNNVYCFIPCQTWDHDAYLIKRLQKSYSMPSGLVMVLIRLFVAPVWLWNRQTGRSTSTELGWCVSEIDRHRLIDQTGSDHKSVYTNSNLSFWATSTGPAAKNALHPALRLIPASLFSRWLPRNCLICSPSFQNCLVFL